MWLLLKKIAIISQREAHVGIPVNSIVPKHIYKILSYYKFCEHTHFETQIYMSKFLVECIPSSANSGKSS